LKSEGTWESKLTKAGQTSKDNKEKAEKKAEAWKDLFNSGKMPYMALLRNLRNILEQAPELTDKVCGMLVKRNLIEQSLVLPFRFISAYEEVEKLKKGGMFEKDESNIDRVLVALDDAMKTSVANLPTLYGKTVILSDNSGSMTGDRGGSSLTSRLSNIKTSDIANLFAVLYWLKADNTLVGLFGDNLIHPKLNRKTGVFENFKKINEEKNKCGASTERGIFDMFEKLIEDKTVVDTIVVFSDCQIGDGCNWYDYKGNRGGDFNRLYQKYKNEVNPSARVYSVDLKGYGTNVFDESVIKIAGWSDKIFDIMKVMEQDKKALIKTINEYVDF
jgi:60 kDa SS-A/Ro ribonucleoprotein